MNEWHWTPEQIGGLTLFQLLCIGQKRPPRQGVREINSEADVEALLAEAKEADLAFSEPMPRR